MPRSRGSAPHSRVGLSSGCAFSRPSLRSLCNAGKESKGPSEREESIKRECSNSRDSSSGGSSARFSPTRPLTLPPARRQSGTDPSIVEERRVQLQTFMQELCKTDVLAADNGFHKCAALQCSRPATTSRR